MARKTKTYLLAKTNAEVCVASKIEKRGNSKKPVLSGPDLILKQICTGAWKDTYSLFGLDKTGAVWRYDYGCGGWIPYCMKQAPCEHRR